MIAVDVGNARIKLGWFDRRGAGGACVSPVLLPEPRQTLALDDRAPDFAALAAWLAAINALGGTGVSPVLPRTLAGRQCHPAHTGRASPTRATIFRECIPGGSPA